MKKIGLVILIFVGVTVLGNYNYTKRMKEAEIRLNKEKNISGMPELVSVDAPYEKKKEFIEKRKVALSKRKDKDSHQFFCDKNFFVGSEIGKMCHDCFDKKIDISKKGNLSFRCMALMQERSGLKEIIPREDFLQSEWYQSFINK